MVYCRIVFLDCERQQSILELARILRAYRFDNRAERRTLGRSEPAHDAQVEIDDLATTHSDVARVWVGMEEAMVENLRSIVVEHLLANFFKIVSFGYKPLVVIDGNALNVFHDQAVLAAQLGIDLRAVYECNILVELAEQQQVLGFDFEIGLVEKRVPHFLDDLRQVDHLHARRQEALRSSRHDAHDVNVLRHRCLHARALHFDSHDIAI